ncbi:MAG: AAA family ATPase [Firmicutes bacterium]|nr:AAA family ATPase [Bacillota bacterium]
MMACVDQEALNVIPEFFDRMAAEDFEKGTKRTKAFVDDLRSFLVGGAFINGDFTIAESAAVSKEIRGLMAHALRRGVKIDYAIGRVREKTTPLNEESYRRDEPAGPSVLDGLEIFSAPGVAGGIGGAGPEGGAGTPDMPGAPGASSGMGGAGQPGSAQDAVAQSAAQAVEAVEDTRTMEELMEELDDLVGLDSIKKDIHSLMNFITITKLREERGLSVPTVSYHLVFTGNPGTGKTTVARLVAGLYRQIGILPKGQLVEVDRGQLVAGYTGQTAIKTMAVIKKALGGVLFIDEAYALVNDEQDSFGKEAVETILKAMEDHRDELVVIVAGYTELMHKFIDSNPGFKSRFSKFFEFPDYTGDELLQIFKRFCDSNGYRISEEAETLLREKLEEMYQQRSRHFGNGRTVRNIFEKAIHEQANRLSGEEGVSDEALQELSLEDVRAAVEAESGKFRELEV